MEAITKKKDVKRVKRKSDACGLWISLYREGSRQVWPNSQRNPKTRATTICCFRILEGWRNSSAFGPYAIKRFATFVLACAAVYTFKVGLVDKGRSAFGGTFKARVSGFAKRVRPGWMPVQPLQEDAFVSFPRMNERQRPFNSGGAKPRCLCA